MMMPVDPEVFAQVKADVRARRGPFRYDVVLPYELVSHYGVNRIKKTQSFWMLRQIGLPEVNAGGPTFFLVDRSLEITPAQTHAHFRRERGLSG